MSVSEQISLGFGAVRLFPLPKSEQELQAIKDWGPSLVLGLVEPAEFAASPLNLPAEFGAERYYHFPVPDMGIPQNDDLAKFIDQILPEIRKGAKVAIHCMGGKGRSGMVALRMMIKLGIQDELAAGEIRTRQPGAIETQEQYLWATGQLGLPKSD